MNPIILKYKKSKLFLYKFHLFLLPCHLNFWQHLIHKWAVLDKNLIEMKTLPIQKLIIGTVNKSTSAKISLVYCNVGSRILINFFFLSIFIWFGFFFAYLFCFLFSNLSLYDMVYLERVSYCT
jgi:hypothetical protein